MQRRSVAIGIALGLLAGRAPAWSAPVTLPDTSQTSSATAMVIDQASITVPTSIQFTIIDVTAATDATQLQSVSVTNIVIHDGKSVRVSLAPNAALFTKPAGATVTWSASDVSWDAPTWINGTGTAGSLSPTPGAYTTVATSAANPTGDLSTSSLKFTLAPKAVDRAGDYSLVATWKVEAF